jgi:hypothetical protein
VYTQSGGRRAGSAPVLPVYIIRGPTRRSAPTVHAIANSSSFRFLISEKERGGSPTVREGVNSMIAPSLTVGLSPYFVHLRFSDDERMRFQLAPIKYPRPLNAPLFCIFPLRLVHGEI